MFGQPRPPLELQVYQCLDGRRNFSKEENHAYYRFKKGFEGEMYFARVIRENLTTPYIALYGLCYETKGTTFQPDCILLLPNQLHLVEIKNFEGEYVLQSDYLVSHVSNKNYRNPLHQLQRCHMYLTEMLHRLKIPLPAHPFISFVNKNFTLFRAEPNHIIILPTQLKNYLQHLNEISGQLPEVYHQYKKRLILAHNSDSPHARIPPYSYESLRKGVLCQTCRRPMVKDKRQAYCPSCSQDESIDSCIMRMVLDFHTLFPEWKITAGYIHGWSEGIVSQKTIARILGEYMKKIGHGRGAHYIFYPRK